MQAQRPARAIRRQMAGTRFDAVGTLAEGRHGGNFIYYFGAFGLGEVDAGEPASDAGGGVGLFDLVYDAAADGAARKDGREYHFTTRGV